MPKYKLTYFNAKARAEVPRLMFAKAGVEYEDVRLKKPEFDEIKDSKARLFLFYDLGHTFFIFWFTDPPTLFSAN